MKIKISLFGILFFCASLLFGQTEPADTSNADADLPELQLKEYTIVGLAKVILPQKTRTQIFKKVEIDWVKNEDIWKKDLPAITFGFSRVKPSLFQLYEFPWLDSELHYGTYNSIGFKLNTQFKIKNWMPYFSVNFLDSDGHEENANRDDLGLDAGFHYQLNKRGLLHAGTDYQKEQRGIWISADKNVKPVLETEVLLWQNFISWEQEWSENISSISGINFYNDELTNALNYQDQGFDATAGVTGKFGSILFESGIDYQKSEVAVENGNTSRTVSGMTVFEDYNNTLSRIYGNLQLHYKNLKFKAGASGFSAENDSSFSEIYPMIALDAGMPGQSKISIVYQPGFEIWRNRHFWQQNSFADFYQIPVFNITSRWQAGADFHLYQGVFLNFSGKFSTIENYFAPGFSFDSLSVNLPSNGYEGIVHNVLPEIQLNEFTARYQWKIRRKFNFYGLASFIKSEIRQNLNQLSITGNQVPYLSKISVNANLDWNFYKKHAIILSAEYFGDRYADLQNQVKLDAYFLFNARINVMLSQNFLLFFQGNNLFDSQYEILNGFTAPGINGFAGIKIVM